MLSNCQIDQNGVIPFAERVDAQPHNTPLCGKGLKLCGVKYGEVGRKVIFIMRVGLKEKRLKPIKKILRK